MIVQKVSQTLIPEIFFKPVTSSARLVEHLPLAGPDPRDVIVVAVAADDGAMILDA